MSTDTKTPFDHVNDTLTQLKEMRHYSKNNVERLTTQWLLFDGELKKLKKAEKAQRKAHAEPAAPSPDMPAPQGEPLPG